MKKKYKEQYKTCIFLARVSYYTMTGSDEELVNRIFTKIDILDEKCPLFKRYIKPSKINLISKSLFGKLPSISWIFKLPFINHYYSTNPRKCYQIWCEEFNDFFSTEEIEKIINENLSYDDGHDGPGRDYQAEMTWNLMQAQRHYTPFLSEIKWIYNNIKFNTYF